MGGRRTFWPRRRSRAPDTTWGCVRFRIYASRAAEGATAGGPHSPEYTNFPISRAYTAPLIDFRAIRRSGGVSIGAASATGPGPRPRLPGFAGVRYWHPRDRQIRDRYSRDALAPLHASKPRSDTYESRYATSRRYPVFAQSPDRCAASGAPAWRRQFPRIWISPPGANGPRVAISR